LVTIKFLMEFLLNLDLFLFKLINLNGEVSFDKTMIFLSNKYILYPFTSIFYLSFTKNLKATSCGFYYQLFF